MYQTHDADRFDVAVQHSVVGLLPAVNLDFATLQAAQQRASRLRSAAFHDVLKAFGRRARALLAA